MSGICRTIKHMQTSKVENTILLSCSNTPSCPPSPKYLISSAIDGSRFSSVNVIYLLNLLSDGRH